MLEIMQISAVKSPLYCLFSTVRCQWFYVELQFSPCIFILAHQGKYSGFIGESPPCPVDGSIVPVCGRLLWLAPFRRIQQACCVYGAAVKPRQTRRQDPVILIGCGTPLIRDLFKDADSRRCSEVLPPGM